MEKDVSISVVRANLVMFVFTIPLTAGLAGIFIAFWGMPEFLNGLFGFLTWRSLIPTILIGVPLHEFLHAAGWVLFSRAAPRDIRLGFQWKMLTPYAHLLIPVSVYGYRMGTFLPGLVLGFIPFFFSTFIGSGWACMFGLFFIFAAGGDLLTLWIIRGLGRSDLVRDHPSRVGCLVVEES